MKMANQNELNKIGRPPVPATERFLKKIVRHEVGCWGWIGAPESYGYGQVADGKKTIKAHRLSWMYFIGPIPAGLSVLHRCNNRICVNPEHLYLGTHIDNMKDRKAAGMYNIPHKIDISEIPKIVGMSRSGISYRQIAKKVGLGKSQVCNIVNAHKEKVA